MCNEVKSNCKYYINSLPSKLRRAFECDIYEIYKDNTCFSVNITKLSKPKQTKRYKFECPLELRVHPSKKYSLKVGDETVANCGVPCQDDALIGRSERQFARYWILAWAILCFASTLFTIATYFIDRTRFRYPERPIILISGCYCMISIAYICGAFLGSSASCAGPFKPDDMGAANLRYSTKLITQGTTRETCTLLFIVIYYFSTAGAIWWLVLTTAWFLSSGPKWSHEAIAANSAYFHAAAWTIPAVMTIAVLALRQVDGDELSGTCFTGLSNDTTTLKWFVLAPLSLYLVLGACLLIAGFVSLFRIRTVMKLEGTKTVQLERLMLRIGVFSISYAIPAAITIACLGYEASRRHLYLQTWYTRRCHYYSIPCPRGADRTVEAPPLFVALTRHSARLVVGVAALFWVWSAKTYDSWRRVYDRLRGRRPRLDSSLQLSPLRGGHRTTRFIDPY